MPTYLGRNIVTIPATPSAPASFEFSQTDIVGLSVSPFTGQQQVQDWQAKFREARVTLPNLTDAQAQAWITFLSDLKGVAGVFQFGAAISAKYPASIGSRYWCLKSNTRGWTINPNRTYTISFEIREVL